MPTSDQDDFYTSFKTRGYNRTHRYFRGDTIERRREATTYREPTMTTTPEGVLRYSTTRPPRPVSNTLEYGLPRVSAVEPRPEYYRYSTARNWDRDVTSPIYDFDIPDPYNRKQLMDARRESSKEILYMREARPQQRWVEEQVPVPAGRPGYAATVPVYSSPPVYHTAHSGGYRRPGYTTASYGPSYGPSYGTSYSYGGGYGGGYGGPGYAGHAWYGPPPQEYHTVQRRMTPQERRAAAGRGRGRGRANMYY